MASIIRQTKAAILAIAEIINPGFIEKRRVKGLYKSRARESATCILPFMNYGYVPLSDHVPALKLRPEHEPFRLPAQLYHLLTSAVDLAGKRVLDVGCGRGGGCYFLQYYCFAQHVVGLDLSKSNIRLCKAAFPSDDIEFRVGDAESLPFPDESFDAVVNVESAHHYPHVDRFYSEVHRVLVTGGYFLYTDIFEKENRDARLHFLRQAKFQTILSGDITANILAALDAKTEAWGNEIREHFHDEKQRDAWVNWSRLKGTELYAQLADGREAYIYSIMRKDS